MNEKKTAREIFGGMRPQDKETARVDRKAEVKNLRMRVEEIFKEWEEVDGMNVDLLAVYKGDLVKVLQGDKSVIAKIEASSPAYPLEFGEILKEIDRINGETGS